MAFVNVRVMRIDGIIQTDRFHPDEIKYALAAPFFGKGYPEECQIVLQLWDRYCSKQMDRAQCLLFGECDANGNVADHSADGGTGHIMITEPGTLAKKSATGPATVDVVESTGPVGKMGLQRSQCTILSMPKQGVFHIQRGVPSKKNTAQEFMHVRIVQLWAR